MRRNAFLIISAILCIAFASISSLAQVDEYGRWENGVTEPWFFNYERYPHEDAFNAQTRWKLIEAENKVVKENEWAGDYSWGEEVHLSILRWSPDAGFVRFGVYTCLPEVRFIDYGSVVATPSYVLVTSEAIHKKLNSKTTKYLPVKWGERHYLISEDQIKEFWNYVAGYGWKKDKYVPLDFLVRAGDEDKLIEGLPIFPPGYEQFVKKPIDATIIAVGSSYIKTDPEDEWWNELITPVTLNVGRVKGVKRDMSFNVLGIEDSETVDIIKVGKNTSEGIIVRHVRKNPGVKINEWDDGKNPEYPKVEVGWKLSTSSHK